MAQEKETCALVLVGCFWLFNLENTNNNSKLQQATKRNLQEEGTGDQISDAGREPDADQHATEP